MNQKTALGIAVALTAFLLVVGGAVAGRLTGPAAVAAADDQAPPIESAVALPVEELQAQMQQREAQYQALLAEANQRLEQAYAQQAAVTQPVQVDQTAAALQIQQDQISPLQAMSAAVITAPDIAILRPPELVDFEGTIAYEVVTDRGILYINASNGAVMYDGTILAENTQLTFDNSRQGSSDRDSDHDDDHEGYDDD